MDRVRDISVELGRGAQHHKAQEVPKKQARQSSTDGTNAHIASEQDVIMAYSLILGREPENSAAVQNVLRKVIPFTEMRDNFIKSVEFRQNVIGRIGGMLQPLDWDANPVETEVDDDTLALFYAHVEQVWSNLGVAEPHYSVLTDQRFKSGRFKQHAAEFVGSGSNSLRVFKK